MAEYELHGIFVPTVGYVSFMVMEYKNNAKVCRLCRVPHGYDYIHRPFLNPCLVRVNHWERLPGHLQNHILELVGYPKVPGLAAPLTDCGLDSRIEELFCTSEWLEDYDDHVIARWNRPSARAEAYFSKLPLGHWERVFRIR